MPGSVGSIPTQSRQIHTEMLRRLFSSGRQEMAQRSLSHLFATKREVLQEHLFIDESVVWRFLPHCRSGLRPEELGAEAGHNEMLKRPCRFDGHKTHSHQKIALQAVFFSC